MKLWLADTYTVNTRIANRNTRHITSNVDKTLQSFEYSEVEKDEPHKKSSSTGVTSFNNWHDSVLHQIYQMC